MVPKPVKILKPGKVVVILQGRYAGRKAVVVRVFENGNQDQGHSFGSVLVAGIDRSPRAVNKSMSKTRILRRSKIKPFVKFINVTHVMATRYTCDFDLKSVFADTDFNDADSRENARKEVRRLFETRKILV